MRFLDLGGPRRREDKGGAPTREFGPILPSDEADMCRFPASVDAIQGEATEFLKTIVAIDSTLDKGEEEVQTTILKLLQETLGSGADVEASGAKS